VGVHSLSTDESLKVLFGEEQYDRWTFTVDRLKQGSANVSGIGPEGLRRGSGPVRPHNAGGIPNIPRARWIGRPFREGLMPEGGGLPGQAGQPGVPGPQGGTGPNGRPPGTGPTFNQPNRDNQ
jgi:hypothetical protein